MTHDFHAIAASMFYVKICIENYTLVYVYVRELHNSPIVNLDIRLERVPIAEVDSESFGSDNTRSSLTMSLSLENVRRSSQQSRERTVSLVRDMSSVEEHTMSGNDDMGSVPGPSSQLWYVI